MKSKKSEKTTHHFHFVWTTKKIIFSSYFFTYYGQAYLICSIASFPRRSEVSVVITHNPCNIQPTMVCVLAVSSWTPERFFGGSTQIILCYVFEIFVLKKFENSSIWWPFNLGIQMGDGLEFIDMPSFDWMKGDSAANEIIISDP
jgi:hypothetical protein